MKCRKCGGQAVLELPRHNAAFCSADFQEFFRKQVAEAIRKHKMFTRDESGRRRARLPGHRHRP